MELGHQFSALIIRSSIFTQSQYTPAQSHGYLKSELLSYQKPTIVVVDETNLSDLTAMIALVDSLSGESVELAVISPQSVTFRGERPVTIQGDFWSELAQGYEIKPDHKIQVCNWNGLRACKLRSLSYFVENGWNAPDQFTQLLSDIIPTDTDPQNRR